MDFWSGFSFPGPLPAWAGGLWAKRLWHGPCSSGHWVPASLSAEADLGLSLQLSSAVSRKLQILGSGPEGKERGFSMFLIVPMTIQEQSRASRCLLPPASAQLFWPRGPISSVCLWEHWAFVSLRITAVCPGLSQHPPLQAEQGRPTESQSLLHIPNPSPSEAKSLVHDI